VKLGSVSDIQSDNSVALRVDVPSLEAIDGVPYWRILTLDKYDQGYFRLSDDLKGRPLRAYPRKVRELMGRDLLDDRAQLDRQSAEQWTLYLEGSVTQFLPVPGTFHSMRFDGLQDLTVIKGVHHVGLDEVRQQVFSYQIEDLSWSHRFPAMQLEVDAFAGVPMPVEGTGLNYPLTNLELSMNAADRTVLTELNGLILGDQTPETVAAYSELITGYLWKNYSYTLSPGFSGEGDDDVVRWLRHARAGHCEYFAGAFILLARDAGYPARMVVGFMGGAWNTVEEYFVVRNDNAHAWVEIYDAQSQEWLRVDPTPGNGSSNPDTFVPTTQQFEAGWGAWVDSLRIQWYRRVVNFDQGDQIDMAITAKDFWDEFADSFSKKTKAISASFKEWWSQPFSGDGLVKIVIAVCLLIASWGLWHARYFFLELLYRLLRRPKALDPMRRQASRCLKKLKSKGIQHAVCAELEAIRFGPPVKRDEAKPILQRARQALRKR
jgi:hypothetical protein